MYPFKFALRMAKLTLVFSRVIPQLQAAVTNTVECIPLLEVSFTLYSSACEVGLTRPAPRDCLRLAKRQFVAILAFSQTYRTHFAPARALLAPYLSQVSLTDDTNSSVRQPVPQRPSLRPFFVLQTNQNPSHDFPSILENVGGVRACRQKRRCVLARPVAESARYRYCLLRAADSPLSYIISSSHSSTMWLHSPLFIALVGLLAAPLAIAVGCSKAGNACTCEFSDFNLRPDFSGFPFHRLRSKLKN